MRSTVLLFVASRVSCASLVAGILPFLACEPRRDATYPAGEPTATSASVTAAPTVAPTPSATPTATATAATVPAIPAIIAALPSAVPWPTTGVAGMPASPRAALLGVWKVTSIDGRAVSTAPGMIFNPIDPASWAAGATLTFTDATVTVARAGMTVLVKPYKVLSELPPVRVVIDAGYGPSNVDFAPDGTAIWSVPSVPPHALTLAR